MVYIVRDAALSRARPAAAGKLIRAEAFWAWSDARALLEKAQHDAALVREEAHKAFAVQQQLGLAAGRQEARSEQAQAMMQMADRTRAHLEGVEERLVALVGEAVRKVIDDADAGTRVRSVVQRALALVRGQKQLTLRVNPAQADALRADLERVLAPFPTIECVDVAADARIAPDACLLESEIGVVEASLPAQLAALEAALKGASRAVA
ncbi:HrpE/YscL family type III secretion apparatus protein [Rhizobacter sp. SG703]|uniref:HrpE/YscL family type III secretion apparatus protein n=1 Tax=Rhizobacter sp. SG703 TaxID=2587140 RepID=UPI001447A552|nr:HrpE/YscL family type III secretion apparatus protein [Rhizobacter sp. SG703]NKI94053.1 type III secretion protein L [Rhizobacter sp. SG703]